MGVLRGGAHLGLLARAVMLFVGFAVLLLSTTHWLQHCGPLQRGCRARRASGLRGHCAGFPHVGSSVDASLVVLSTFPWCFSRLVLRAVFLHVGGSVDVSVAVLAALSCASAGWHFL